MTSQANCDVLPLVLLSWAKLCSAQLGKPARRLCQDGHSDKSMWSVRSVSYKFNVANFCFSPPKLKRRRFGLAASTLNPLFYCMTEEELLIFDLQSLATLAAARALEMGAQEGDSAASGRCFPARRTLNLRRKFNWTPRNEPVNKTLFECECCF